MAVLPFISSIHHQFCSSFGLKCLKTQLIRSIWNAQGLINTEWTVPKSYTDMNIYYTLFEGISVHKMGLGLSRVFLWILVHTCMGKGCESRSGKRNQLSSKKTLKCCRFVFFFLERNGKEQKAETSLTSPSFYFGRAAEKLIEQQRKHMEEGHDEHANPKWGQLLLTAQLVQDCHEAYKNIF